MELSDIYAPNVLPLPHGNLYPYIKEAWSAETSDDPRWGQEGVPAETGQSAVTALLIYDTYLGMIHQATVNGTVHYWNTICGRTLDFTYEQFKLPLTVGETSYPSREDLLALPGVAERYEVFRSQYTLL